RFPSARRIWSIIYAKRPLFFILLPDDDRAASRHVAGYLALIDCIDLRRIHEFFGIAQVDLFAHEDVEQIGIDVIALLEAAQDTQRFAQTLAGLVGPVLGRQGFEDVGNSHHARLDRHFIALQAARIARTVHLFMVPAGVFRHALEVFRPKQRFEHAYRHRNVVVDDLALVLGQRAGAYGEVGSLFLV